jgi:pyruvate/2-oxoglutarate dehydrogenase complex dihydrolipoamide dehydrogenase (E3) component
LPGLDDVDFLTNETVFDLTILPPTLVVLGAGPVGCEMAQAFARFGSSVHLVNRSGEVLTREEPDSSALLRRQLESEGIQLHLGAKLVRLEKAERQRKVILETGGNTRTIETDALLVAVGRRANVANLGLEEAGVVYSERGVHVNDFLQTSNPRIYAAGDICGSFQFTHAADEMARIVLRNALFFGRERLSGRVIPWCTYTEPEVARVGLSTRQAAERGIKINTVRVPFAEVDRAILDGDAEGFAFVHVSPGHDRILGGTIVGPHAGELIGQITLAMTNGLGLSALARTVQPYPTLAEALKRVGDNYQRSRLTPRIASWMRKFLRWRR